MLVFEMVARYAEFCIKCWEPAINNMAAPIESEKKESKDFPLKSKQVLGLSYQIIVLLIHFESFLHV